MSYDINIGRESFNYTYNVSGMWYAAKPEKGIRCFYGKTGAEALQDLKEIRDYMEDHRDELLKMEPANGWGSYQGALDFVNKLIAASLSNPSAVWEGD